MERHNETQRRRETILVSLITFGIIVAAMTGVWFLIQLKGPEGPAPEGSQEHPGTPAPDFSLTDLGGNILRLSDFKGKVVVIDFMATWCGPCKQQISHFKTIWEGYGNKIVLMSIDVDPKESEEVLKAFAQEFPYATWIWARDTANLAQAYEVTAIPKTIIIDQRGYIRFTHTGVTDASIFIEEINQLLGEGG